LQAYKKRLTLKIDNSYWLFTTPIAHRGLWGDNAPVPAPENTLLAYQNAIEHNFPIEIDVHLSTDGEIFVFHDDDLTRLTGASGKIFEKSSNELKSLFIENTSHKIPTLDQVLELVDGKVPLLIEIKNQPTNKIVKILCDRLKKYKGQFAVQSFNPAYIIKVKKIAPEFVRGILSSKSKLKNKVKTFIKVKMALNFIAKPHFVSYKYSDLPIKTKYPTICWTITDIEKYNAVSAYAKNYIFEHFIPKK
jgi:glycerophosphoryl diester phosphodiesterase